MHIHELIAFQGQLLSEKLSNNELLHEGRDWLQSRPPVLQITAISKTCFEENAPPCACLCLNVGRCRE